MGRKSKFTPEEKLKVIETIQNGIDSACNQARLLGIDQTTIQRWICNYMSLGMNGLITANQNVSYSKTLKEAAVLDYLSGLGSLMDICQKYGIRSKEQLRNWILKYNGHEELKTSGTGGTEIMAKGRKTTFDERVEIVTSCIENEMNYAVTAESYQVSYQQVYQWVKKYESKGVDGLLDKRGRKKPENERSELDKLRAENRLLQAEKRRMELENAFLKKLEEIERGRS